MADTFSQRERSRIMACVKGKNTKPELAVRRSLHRLGYRYRLHLRSLPGAPDIVLPRYGAVIQVRGCFWHGHACQRGARLPATNEDYWRRKIQRTIQRDARNDALLRRWGWSVLTVWECNCRNAALLAREVRRIQRRLDAKL